MKSFNDFQKEVKKASVWQADSLIREASFKLRKEYAKKKGWFRSVSDPDGLKELTPPLRNPIHGDEYTYNILDDGRVHKLFHGQYEYLHGPQDEGIIKHSEWIEGPNNLSNDITNVLENLIYGSDRIYWNKDLIEEIREMALNFLY